MGVKDFGKHKYKISMGDGYIQDMFAIQNDTDSRVYEFQIFNTDGNLGNASGLSLKLAIDNGDGKVIICDSTLTDSANAIFTATLTTEQLIKAGKKKAQIMLIEGTKNLRSKTFTINVGESLFEGGTYGKNIVIEFEKIGETIRRLDDIESSFIRNANLKTEEYNDNHAEKLKIYNDNHAEKIREVEEGISVDLTKYYTKETVDSKLGDFNQLNTSNKFSLVSALNEVKDSTDEKLSSNDIVNNLTAGGTNKVLSAEQGKLLFQSVSNGKQLVASAITDRGVQTDATAEFSVMADNIRKIQSGSSETDYETMILNNQIVQYSEYAFGFLDQIYNTSNSPYFMWDINLQDLFDHSGNINLMMLSNVMMTLGNYIFEIQNQIEEIKNALERFSNGEIVFDKDRMMPTDKPLDWLVSFIRTAMPAV